jgi:hypothetical protein
MTAALPLALACLAGMGLAGGAEPSAVCVVAVSAVVAGAAGLLLGAMAPGR